MFTIPLKILDVFCLYLLYNFLGKRVEFFYFLDSLSSKMLIRGAVWVANSKVLEGGYKNRIRKERTCKYKDKMLLGMTINYNKTAGERRN